MGVPFQQQRPAFEIDRRRDISGLGERLTGQAAQRDQDCVEGGQCNWFETPQRTEAQGCQVALQGADIILAQGEVMKQVLGTWPTFGVH